MMKRRGFGINSRVYEGGQSLYVCNVDSDRARALARSAQRQSNLFT